MDQETSKQHKVIGVLAFLKELSLFDQLEILMNVFVMLSLSNLDTDISNIKTIEDFEKCLMKEIASKNETLAIALGKQAMIINLWLSNSKEKYK